MSDRLADAVEFIDKHDGAFAFGTTLILALLTAAYVLLTWRLAKAQERLIRIASEPVLPPRVEMTSDGLRVTLRNVSAAIASGAACTPGPAGSAKSAVLAVT